jgi:hypothetical protein
MAQNIAGTFASGGSSGVGQTSAELVIPTGVTQARLTIRNDTVHPDNSVINGSNTCKTQKSTNNGQTWVDQVTYNRAQNNTAITVVPGEHWRLVLVSQQAGSNMHYSLSVES